MLKKIFNRSSTKGTKIRPVRNKKANRILHYFVKGYNGGRVILELIIPIFLTVSILLLFHFTSIDIKELLEKIKEINEFTANIIAIQIGFNITSLALIASFNSDLIKNTFSRVAEEKKEQSLKQLLSSFVYCILIQTWIIIFATVYNTAYQSLGELLNFWQIPMIGQKIIVYAVFLLWMFTLIHSFIVFYRNVILIYKFTILNVSSKRTS
jgi:hypothetical protein